MADYIEDRPHDVKRRKRTKTEEEMLTIDALKELGANTDEGLGRCLNNEEFYLKLVKMAVEDQTFEQLQDALEKNDLDDAFERAHALKGVLGNVSLTNILEPIKEITEDLRSRTEKDYTDQMSTIMTELKKVRALI